MEAEGRAGACQAICLPSEVLLQSRAPATEHQPLCLYSFPASPPQP